MKKIVATPARQAAVPTDTHQEQGLAADPVDYRHRDHGEKQVRGPDRDCLKVARHFAEAGMSENVIQIIENRVDAGELVEYSDADREEDREKHTFG